MESPEKTLLFLEDLQSFNDEDIAEAIPLPIAPALLRMAIAGASAQVPDDAAELDAMLTSLGEFCLRLRSDRDELSAAA